MRTEILKSIIYKGKNENDIQEFEDFLSEFDADVQRCIEYIVRNNLHDLDLKCMIEIILALHKDLDIKWLTSHDFNHYQMKEIRTGLEKGLDVSIYANPEFDWEEMEVIRMGLEKGLDVSVYAKPELDWEQMQKIRLELENQ